MVVAGEFARKGEGACMPISLKALSRKYTHHLYQKAIREAGRGSLHIHPFSLMKNNVQPRNLYPAELSFENEGKILAFNDK